MVLFGANSSGKTSVLEAIEEILTRKQRRRFDPAEGRDRVPISGYVWFELDKAHIPGHPDAELHRALKVESAWAIVGKGVSEVFRGATAQEVEDTVAMLLADAGRAGTREDRQQLARALVSSRMFFAGFESTYLRISGDVLPVKVRAMADRIASASADESDELGRLARQVISGGPIELAELDRSLFGAATVTMLPPVVVVDPDPTQLGAELRGALEEIHDRLWALPDQPPVPGAARQLDGFLISHTRESGYEPDRWLEGFEAEISTDSGEGVPEARPRPGTGDWHRIRPSLHVSAQMLEARINKNLPSFVSDLGHVEIDLLPPSVWYREPNRLRVVFVEEIVEVLTEGTLPEVPRETIGRETRRDLAVIGAGIARWAAAAARLACLELRNGDQFVKGPDGKNITETDRRSEHLRVARDSPSAAKSVWIEPRTTPAVYLVDEPEAHLHPGAVQSVAEWLCQLSARASCVVVATHHPALLNLPTDVATNVLVRRKGDLTELVHVGNDVGRLLEEAGANLGVGRAELLLMTRLFLFVEGPHDRAVLEGMFGADLMAAGIRVVPLHGIDNAVALAESELVADLSIPIAVFGDATNRSTVASGGSTREERVLARLVREATRVGRHVEIFGHSKRDILEWLDGTVCTEAAPTFPGWDLAIEACRRGGPIEHWKSWITATYGLQLNRDDVRRLAIRCKELGHLPAELRQVVKSIVKSAPRAGSARAGK